MTALAAGTYGAHGFKPADPVYKTVYQTGNIYHLVHSSALLAAPLSKRPNLFGGLCSFGIVTFSGTCYLVALKEDRSLSKPAPVGGFAFIAAWASLLF
ncbi:uncharacterized protein [Physcomitrium patens]|nr:transmembrane protein 256 homolog isoform X2 [Physcomitrium patens]|eukprot:XP_024378862.1 transmembrane protein 256 homolog isoform X2 [Physcomitrella patens]